MIEFITNVENLNLIVSYLKGNYLLGNSLWSYLLSFFIFIVLVGLVYMFKFILIQKLKSLNGNIKNNIISAVLDIIINFPKYLVIIICFYVPLKSLNLSLNINRVLDVLLLISLAIELVQIGNKFIEFRLKSYFLDKDNKGDKTKLNMFKMILNIVLRIVGILIILVNLGVEITPLLTSLGIGGIAIAFALQNILQDIFSSFSIYFDKPFKIGDFVSIGTDSGTIQKIGIKSTHIKTLKGNQLVVSNKELTNARVNNFAVMKNRRVEFILGFTYETSKNNLKKIPELITNIFASIDNVELNRVHFIEFGPYSLNFKIVFTVNSKDIEDELSALNNINYSIFEIMKDNGIDFAYPTQTLYLNK